MPGLVPGIHAFNRIARKKTWMAGTSPAMTNIYTRCIVTETLGPFLMVW
jgi:hypothetical protein